MELNGYINPTGVTVKYFEYKSKTWSKYYQCHCAETVRKRAYDDMESATKKRPVQKERKKREAVTLSFKFPSALKTVAM